MKISFFPKGNKKYISQTAKILQEVFPTAYSDSSIKELKKCLEEDRIALIAVKNDHVVGFIGAIPQYNKTGWELHPLVVKKSEQFKGIGTALIKALEQEVVLQGGITIFLGSDDESNKTSLSNTDLYIDTFQKIEHISNINKHPYEFYQKLGYKIVGVIPDANGIGKPDIIIAKRVK